MIEVRVHPTLSEIERVARSLRSMDKRELAVTRNLSDWESLALSAYAGGALGGYSALGVVDDVPALSFGATRFTLEPSRVHVWAFGTDEAPRVFRLVTKHIRRVMIPYLLSQGALNAQAVSHPEHLAAHRWLSFLGFKSKAKISGIGPRCEDMVLFTASANDFSRSQSVPHALVSA